MNDIGMNWTFIIAAYAVSWAVILGYFARLALKGSKARAEYDRVASDSPGAAR